VARQPTSIETLKVYASDTLAAHQYLTQAVKTMESAGLTSLPLHATVVDSIYLPAVIAFAIDSATQASIEMMAKRTGAVSYTVRVMEKVAKRKHRAAQKKQDEAPAPPAAAPAPAPVKKPRKRG
jgi:hypothetical protein